MSKRHSGSYNSSKSAARSNPQVGGVNDGKPPRTRRMIFRFTDFVRNITRRDLKRGFTVVVVGQCVVYVVTTYICSFTMCIGPSMMPTIPDGLPGTLVLIDCLSYKVKKKPFQVGDVVISSSPNDTDKLVCKRIAATAGDSVTIMSKNVNHKVTPYGKQPHATLVPPGHVWLAGDNWNNSTDSRSYGPVSLSLLKGKVCYSTYSPVWYKLFVPVESYARPNDAIIVRKKKMALTENENKERLKDHDEKLNKEQNGLREEETAEIEAFAANFTASPNSTAAGGGGVSSPTETMAVSLEIVKDKEHSMTRRDERR